MPGCDGSEEDVLTYAMFPQVAPGFFASRALGPKNLGVDPAPPAAPAGSPAGEAAPLRSPITYDVKLNGRSHRVSVTPVSE